MRQEILDRPHIVYLAVCNANGKKYVGITNKTLDDRKKDHERHARCQSKLIFHKALIKHNMEFTWSILAECRNRDEAMKLEICYIRQLESHLRSNGYNQTLGGGGAPGYHLDQKSILKRELSHNITNLIKLKESLHFAVPLRDIEYMTHIINDIDELKKKVVKLKNVAKDAQKRMINRSSHRLNDVIAMAEERIQRNIKKYDPMQEISSLEEMIDYRIKLDVEEKKHSTKEMKFSRRRKIINNNIHALEELRAREKRETRKRTRAFLLRKNNKDIQ